jgi:hypothetical protein
LNDGRAVPQERYLGAFQASVKRNDGAALASCLDVLRGGGYNTSAFIGGVVEVRGRAVHA